MGTLYRNLTVLHLSRNLVTMPQGIMSECHGTHTNHDPSTVSPRFYKIFRIQNVKLTLGSCPRSTCFCIEAKLLCQTHFPQIFKQLEWGGNIRLYFYFYFLYNLFCLIVNWYNNLSGGLPPWLLSQCYYNPTSTHLWYIGGILGL